MGTGLRGPRLARVPGDPGGKKPLFTGWQRDATTDPDLIARYWRREPGPNVGLICGEAFVAFDIEVDHLPALSSWMREHGHRLPETPVAHSGRGGIHVLVRPIDGGGRTLHLGGTRIGELKAGGGFIVACPSCTTGPYEWLRGPEDVDCTEAPDWLRGLVTAERPQRTVVEVVGPFRGEAQLAALARTVRDAAVGSRNDLLYWAMRRALDEGVPAKVAGSVLARMATAAGLEEREIGATLRSATEATT